MLSVLRYGLVAAFISSAIAQNVITTIAGADPSFTGDGQPAINVPIGYINGVATDSAGNVYLSDPIEHLLLKVSTNGILSVIAGNGIAAYSGDGGPATSAAIAATDNPVQYVAPALNLSLGGIAVDKIGNVYFADGHYLRRVATDGTISTVAGGGKQVPGDGGPGIQASLGIVNGVALDNAGNLYFCESNRIRKLGSGGTITTFAGTGVAGFSGDNGQATQAQLDSPLGLTFDAQGNLYFTDGDGQAFPTRIRKIAPIGVITTIAGGGKNPVADGVPPLALELRYASGLAVDSTGALFVYSPGGGFLIKIVGNTTSLVTNPAAKAYADNIPASQAYLVGQRVFDNSGIAFDSSGNLYVADSRDGRLAKIDKQGILTTVAGNGAYSFGGDGGPALSAYLQGPANMTVVPNGTLYFLDTLNVRVRAIAPNGTISTVLSTDIFPPLGASDLLTGITSDAQGNVYVILIHRVLEITPDGQVQIIVNQPANVTDRGDGGPALQAGIVVGGGIARDNAGNLYISDLFAAKIRKVTTDGVIHTIAGTGTNGVAPDGVLALGSPISSPSALLADNLGGLYFEETPPPFVPGSAVLRYITPDGHLKTIAGTGQPDFSGDGGLAVKAGLSMQLRTGLALDKAGNLYLADGFNGRIRVINTSGVISTFAGNGNSSSDGDGGLAKNASILIPRGVAVDGAGNVFIADVAANRIREVLATPPAITVTPASMNFSARSNGSTSAPQKLTITSPVAGLAFTISKSTGADWLSLSASAGVTPQLVNIRVDPANLTAGLHQATITVNSGLGVPAATNIAVSVQVAPGTNPKLNIDRNSVSFTFPNNPTLSLTQQVRVSNAGTGSFQFTARAQTNNGGNWLSVNPASGTVTTQGPVQVGITANPAGLAIGTYTGSITINSPTTGETVVVAVNLTISPLDQAIRLSHVALAFVAVAGGGVVPPGSFNVVNIGRGDMPFKISTRTLTGGTWLSATPSSATATNGVTSPRVTVTVNHAGLAPGFYYGLIRVDAPGAANTPHVAVAVLLVLPAGSDPGEVIQPSDIVFSAVQGAPPPGSVNLQIYNIAAAPQSYVSSFVANDPLDRVRFTPADATLNPATPTRVVVQPLTGGLSPGVYEGELTFQFSNGYIRRVGVRTIITAAPPGSTTELDGNVTTTASCAPTQLVPVITTLGQSFGVPSAWPVPLEVEVRDDCGNTLTSGSVKASFSNGDPPLSLQTTANGMWNSTWLSGHNNGPVTLTISANDPSRNLTGLREVTGGLGDMAPAPTLAAAVSGASFAGNTPLAPGSIISLFGQDMSNGNAPATQLPLGFTLAGASVVMAGNSLPLIYSSSGQINAFVNAGITPNTSHQILVQRDNTLSVPIEVDVAGAEPAIFGYPLTGDPPTQGAIVNAVNYNVAHPATPVTAGDILAIFCTGLGAVDQTIPDGAASPTSPPANTTATPTVSVGGKSAKVIFSGLSPGFVGLYQIDAVMPSGVTPGSAVPVILGILGQTGPSATIAVK